MSNGHPPNLPPPPPPSSYPPPPAASYPSPPPPRKGLHPLAWVAIGCGALLLLTFIGISVAGYFAAQKLGDITKTAEANPALAAAKVMAALNPEIEIVSSDDAQQSVTLREKSSGKTATFNFQDIQEGRLSFETEDGTFSVDGSAGEEGGSLVVTTPEGESTYSATGTAAEVPAWVPQYQGARQTAGHYASNTPTEATGVVNYETDAAPREVVDYLAGELEALGYEVQRADMGTGGESGGSVNAQLAAEGRSVNYVVTHNPGETTKIVLQYTERKSQ